MASKKPSLTLYHLQASRSIRIVWLLEELDLEYKLHCFDRESSGLAPPEFKSQCGTLLGKAPVLIDGDLIMQESGAITEYLCENYDPSHRLLPTEPAARHKVREYIHATEGTFMIHCLPTVYNHRIDVILAKKLAPGLAELVAKDLDWLEAELEKSGGKYLVGDHVTAADTMVGFSIQFIFAMDLAPKGRKWERIEEWLKRIEGQEAYKRAVEKTGFKMYGS